MPASDAASPWQGGWYRSAQRVPSVNFGARPAAAVIDLIVVHSISLPPGCYVGDAVAQLFTNTLDWDAHPYFDTIRGLEVSAHFFLRRDGALLQFVDCDARAWHAGRSHYAGKSNRNDDSIGIELEGVEGGLFEASQYAALAGLCGDIAERYPIGHVAGHEHVAPGRKFDPGAGFDWSRFEQLLAMPRIRFAEWA